MKRYLVDERHKIALYDLVMNECERIHAELQGSRFSVMEDKVATDSLSKRLNSYEALVEILTAVFVTGCYWGGDAHEYLWVKSLDRLANAPGIPNAGHVWQRMQRYPVLHLLYAGGIAAHAAIPPWPWDTPQLIGCQENCDPHSASRSVVCSGIVPVLDDNPLKLRTLYQSASLLAVAVFASMQRFESARRLQTPRAGGIILFTSREHALDNLPSLASQFSSPPYRVTFGPETLDPRPEHTRASPPVIRQPGYLRALLE